MKKTWYAKEGGKLAELWTILHLPYTVMCLSFLTIGFAIGGIISWKIYIMIFISYFFGIGLAAHCLDQLPNMGSSYIKYLTEKELIFISCISLAIALSIGISLISQYRHLIWLMPLQTFFTFAYPMKKLFSGHFHTDRWFAVSFGFLPVFIGYYMNTHSFNIIAVMWGVICYIIAYIEILLSRFVRNMRMKQESVYIERPERALKALCVLSYVIAVVVLIGQIR